MESQQLKQKLKEWKKSLQLKIIFNLWFHMNKMINNYDHISTTTKFKSSQSASIFWWLYLEKLNKNSIAIHNFLHNFFFDLKKHHIECVNFVLNNHMIFISEWMFMTMMHPQMLSSRKTLIDIGSNPIVITCSISQI